MPEIVTDSPKPSCSPLLSVSGIEEFQSLGPDRSVPRAREAQSVSRREAPATLVAGRAASAIPGGAYPISWLAR